MTTEPMPLRDSDTLGLRVTRSVPAWTVGAGVIALVVQAVTLQLGQARQGELISDLSRRIVEQNESINRVSLRLDGLNDKANEAKNSATLYSYKLEDLDRRLGVLERGKK